MPAAHFTHHELQAILVTQPFLIKARVTKKVWSTFELLRNALKSEVKDYAFLGQEHIDLSKGQIAKGERFQELPFVYMDFPQYFLPGQACTFRAFFWWGHFVAFALILQGDHLKLYKKNIVSAYSDLVANQIELSLADTPWEWKRGRSHSLTFRPSNRNRVLKAMNQSDFIKLTRFIPLEKQALQPQQLIRQGIRTFRLYRPIITR